MKLTEETLKKMEIIEHDVFIILETLAKTGYGTREVHIKGTTRIFPISVNTKMIRSEFLNRGTTIKESLLRRGIAETIKNIGYEKNNPTNSYPSYTLKTINYDYVYEKMEPKG